MAPCVKQFPVFSLFLFLSVSLFFTNANAGRYFFSKMTRTEKSGNPTEATPESSIPKERNDSTYFPSISQGSGYGLYGHDPEQFSPTTTGTVASTESITNEKLFDGDVHGEFKNRFDNTNDNPYKSSTEFSEGNNGPNYDEKNRPYQYGMSDTRFLENGRYYYDVNSRRYGYGSELNPMGTNRDKYRSYGSYGGGDGTVGRYHGNEGYGNENGNEYNKVLNENENKGEAWSQEYIP
jgi:hypothetical protein